MRSIWVNLNFLFILVQTRFFWIAGILYFNIKTRNRSKAHYALMRIRSSLHFFVIPWVYQFIYFEIYLKRISSWVELVHFRIFLFFFVGKLQIADSIVLLRKNYHAKTNSVLLKGQGFGQKKIVNDWHHPQRIATLRSNLQNGLLNLRIHLAHLRFRLEFKAFSD